MTDNWVGQNQQLWACSLQLKYDFYLLFFFTNRFPTNAVVFQHEVLPKYFPVAIAYQLKPELQIFLTYKINRK